MKKQIIFLLLMISFSGFAQNTTLQGVVLNAVTNEPVEGTSVRLKDRDLSTTTGSDGSFYLEKVPAGSNILVISSPNVQTIELPVNIVAYQANEIGTVYVTANFRNLFSEGSLTLIEEESVSEDAELGDYNISSLMTSSNDVYISNATYNFSPMRFKLRGYENRYSEVYINGINFNDPERGGFSYGLIGGLNDATRSKDNVIGFAPSAYTYGQIGGTSNINTNATNYAPGGRVGLAFTNRSYKLRGMATYSTGLMDNGWALTGSLAYRWADEGFIEGTFYNSLGYFFSAEKVFNSKHSISFTTLGSPTQRAQQSANLQEACDLTDNNYYNSYWGWQDGKKRNSRVVTDFEPAAVLSHKFDINKDTRLTTSLGYKYAMYGSTALNWYNGADPRPDYYRYFPSYQTTPEMKEYYTNLWKQNQISQVDWNRLYRVNALNKIAGDGNALYMVEERHNDQQMLSLNSVLNTKIADRITLNAGIDASATKGMHYKTVSDLLGGDYFLDIDQFAERDKLNYQNDMNNPDRKTVKGDRFGYDYNIHVNSVNAWLQNTHRYNKWDLYYGLKMGYTSFYRYGNMRNGRAPENSYGKGLVHDFITQSTKFGLTYKLSGQHLFSGNISYSILPPLANNAYKSVRIKEDAVNDLTTEKVFSVDVAYNLTTPVFRGRLSLFQTNFYDQTEVYSYYYDTGNRFTNYSVYGINKMNRGVEMGLEAKVNSFITLSLAGTVAEYIYTNRPKATMSFEDGNIPDYNEIVYLKNFYVGGTPQTAGTFGIHGFYNYWFLDLNLNGFDRSYIDISPNKRTESTLNFIANTPEEKKELVDAIISQEKFDGGFTLDFSIGKSIRLKNQRTLNINCQFNNILNNTHLISGGFEQSRYEPGTNKFPAKYYYAQGFNFFLNVGLRF